MFLCLCVLCYRGWLVFCEWLVLQRTLILRYDLGWVWFGYFCVAVLVICLTAVVVGF